MVRNYWLVLLLVVVCAAAAMAQIYNNAICVRLDPGDPRRSQACTAPMGCVNQDSQCIGGVPTRSFFQAENSYQVCRVLQFPVIYKCEELDTSSACVVRHYYRELNCIGYVCTRSVTQKDCRTIGSP
jgi:hypothetical protein